MRRERGSTSVWRTLRAFIRQRCLPVAEREYEFTAEEEASFRELVSAMGVASSRYMGVVVVCAFYLVTGGSQASKHIANIVVQLAWSQVSVPRLASPRFSCLTCAQFGRRSCWW